MAGTDAPTAKQNAQAHWIEACAFLFILAGCGAGPGGLNQGDHGVLLDDPAPAGERGGIGESEFNHLVSEVVGYFQADMDQQGAILRLSANWGSDQFGAMSAKNGDAWLLMTFGGTVRVPEATADGFTAILCHEMGHFFGGEPFLREGISAEAQADFFAASVCLPRVWRQADNTPAPPTPANPALSEDMRNLCASHAVDVAGADLCVRNVRAGWTALNMSAARKNLAPPNAATPDASVAEVTITTYPSLQCRLDTWIAGVSEAGRPRCWYNPGQ